MAVKGKDVKGKQVATKGSSGKRKRDESDKSGNRKRNTSGVLQFFDVAAEVEDDEEGESEEDWFDDDDFLDKTNAGLKDKIEAGKSHHLPFFPKEEELSDDELAELLRERYKPGSKHVVFAEDGYEAKSSLAENGHMPSNEDPTIWKVKCMVGRERYSVFCLMQKYVELESLGTKLQTVSAFALEHAKGYIFIEAYREVDVVEACKGLCSIYSSRLSSVPRNEVPHLFVTRSKTCEVPVGSWARMKYGIYKGDLTQVVAVNANRKRATVKLIPRIDLQAIDKKLSGGGTVKRSSVPAPRLISSSELESFRKHIQYRHDRESGLYFEILDGLMLKDGYLFKRVPIESLCCWDVVPSADELQRFEASKEHQSDDTEWLMGLYGGGRSKCSEKSDNDKTSGSKSTSGTIHESGFELHDLVFFGESDVGVIIGMEESDRFQILKDSEGEVETVTVELDELRSGSDDRKFTPLDHQRETISINDTVSVLEGPFKDRQGIIKQIYRGTLFIFVENQLESSNYFCVKSHLCEKLKLASQGNDVDGPGSSGFEDSMAFPKSPQLSPESSSPKKPWEARGNFRDSNNNGQGDGDGTFSIGQTVRIRIGPLKGYLCRVIAIYRSNVTVKLHCQPKVLSVKCENLSEVRAKTCGEPFRNPASSAEIGNQDWSRDLMDGKGALGESNGWNSGLSTGRNSWPDFTASGFLSTASDPKKDEGDDPWGSNLGPAGGNKAANGWETAIGSHEDQKSSWDKVTSMDKAMGAVNDSVGNWGANADCWGKTTTKDGFGSSKSDGWEKASIPTEGKAGCSRDAGNNWAKENHDGQPMDQNDVRQDQPSSWDKGKDIVGNDCSGEGGAAGNKIDWNNATVAGGWGNASASFDAKGDQGSGWNNDKSCGASQSEERNFQENHDKGKREDSWGKALDSWEAKDGSNRSKTDCWSSATAGGGWNASKTVNASGMNDGWNRQRAAGADEALACGEGGAMENETKQDQNSRWSKSKSFGSDSGFDWKKERVENKDGWGNRDQEGSWDKQKTFDDSGGSGGRRGRGNRGGGRGNFGRGRSYGWNDEGNKCETSTVSGGSQPRWNNGSNRSKSGGENGWNSNVSSEDQHTGWKSGKSDAGGNQAPGWDGGSNWNASKPEKENQSSGIQRGEGDAGGSQSGWDKSSWGTPKVPAEKPAVWNQECGVNGADGQRDQGRSPGPTRGGFGYRGRGRGNQMSGRGRGQGSGEEGSFRREGRGGDGWNNSKTSSEDLHNDWKSGTNDTWRSQASGGDGGSNWNIPKAANENQSSGWQRGDSDAGGNQSGWNKSSWSTPKGEGDTGGNQPGWNKSSCTPRGENDTGGNQSGWDKSSSWNAPKGDSDAGGNQSGGDKSSSWNTPKGGSDAGGNQSGGDKSSNWNTPKGDGGAGGDQSGWNKSSWHTPSGENDAGGNQSGWGKSSWSTPKGSAENPGAWNQGFGANEADGRRDQGRSSGPTRGGFEYRGRGRSNYSNGWGRGRGSGEEGSFRRNGNADDSEHGWSSSGRADSCNQRGGFGNRGRGRRDQSGGRGRGRGFGREGSFNSNQNNDGPGDRTSSWNQGSDATKGQWQDWSVGQSGQSRDGGGASSWGKRNHEKPRGDATASWGASPAGNQKDESTWGNAAGSWGAGSSDKGKESTWGNAAGSWGAGSSDKGKESTGGNAAGSWGTSSSDKGKDNTGGNAAGSWGASSCEKGKENQRGNAADPWGKGSDKDGGAKGGW